MNYTFFTVTTIALREAPKQVVVDQIVIILHIATPASDLGFEDVVIDEKDENRSLSRTSIIRRTQSRLNVRVMACMPFFKNCNSDVFRLKTLVERVLIISDLSFL